MSECVCECECECECECVCVCLCWVDQDVVSGIKKKWDGLKTTGEDNAKDKQGTDFCPASFRQSEMK